MKLKEELRALDTITEKLNIYLAGLRAEGPLVGALEYAQSEAEAIAGVTGRYPLGPPTLLGSGAFYLYRQGPRL